MYTGWNSHCTSLDSSGLRTPFNASMWSRALAGLSPRTYSEATLSGSGGGLGIDMSKRSILVVDDDRSVRSYLSDCVSSCGYSVECAESGDEAVAPRSAGYVPALIVLDIVMP